MEGSKILTGVTWSRGALWVLSLPRQTSNGVSLPNSHSNNYPFKYRIQ
jgi:hypothetical protein